MVSSHSFRFRRTQCSTLVGRYSRKVFTTHTGIIVLSHCLALKGRCKIVQVGKWDFILGFARFNILNVIYTACIEVRFLYTLELTS